MSPWPLPQPKWTRSGETWRVEPETANWVQVYGLCCDVTVPPRMVRCLNRARVGISRSGQKEITQAVCESHLSELGMWVEAGRVVSWRLAP